MRKAVLTIAVSLTMFVTSHGYSQSLTSPVSYSIPNFGAATIETAGAGAATAVGYGRVQPASSTTPSGAAIFGFRLNGVLLSQAGEPGAPAMSSGRTYVEFNEAINTGVAFANPNSAPVVISFGFTDQFGNDFGQTSITLPGGVQITRFLNESPFNLRNDFRGSLTFSASSPVAVTALRTFINERNEPLVTTQPVVPLPNPAQIGGVIAAHFADGGGWKTQLVLLNTTDTEITGIVQFFGEGRGVAEAVPLTLRVSGRVASAFPYAIRPRASASLETSGFTGARIQTGSVRVTPIAGSLSPAVFAAFSFSDNGVTVSQATVQTPPPGTAFRSYVEVNSAGPVPGAVQSSVAIANNSAATATVNFELTTMHGVSAGLTASATIAGFGHLSAFMHDLFPALALPFRGVLRISSFSSIAVMTLLTRYNERGDFLMAATPSSNEASPSSTAGLVFPYIADGGGFTTQFILFSGVAGQISTGALSFIGQQGQPLNLTVR